MNTTKQVNESHRTKLFLLLVIIGVLGMPARSADDQDVILRVTFSPGPKPPPLVATPKPPPDEVFVLNSSYPRTADTNGLYATFDRLRDEVTAIQARVYATNHFLAKLHNYQQKLKMWSTPYNEETGKLMELLEAQSGTPMGATNSMRYNLLYALMIPMSCLELMDDSNFAELITEAVRIQLDPPVPAYPPCMYMLDALLGLPTATNTNLRLPPNPPPSSLAIRMELEARVTLVSTIVRGLGQCDGFPSSALPSMKVFGQETILRNMVELCKRVDYPEDLRRKLDEARMIRARLPRGPLTGAK